MSLPVKEYGIQDIFKMHEWLEVPASNGDPESMYFLARAYLEGGLVPIDYYRSELWAKRADAAGCKDTRYVFPWLYRCFDHSTAESVEAAVQYDFQHAQSGDRWALHVIGDRYRFGKGVEMDLEKAVECFLRSGDEFSQRDLQEMYDAGEWTPEVKPNPRKVIS